jgi:hypothetical protein
MKAMLKGFFPHLIMERGRYRDNDRFRAGKNILIIPDRGGIGLPCGDLRAPQIEVRYRDEIDFRDFAENPGVMASHGAGADDGDFDFI